MQQRTGLRFPQRNPSDKNLIPCRHLSSSWLDSDTRMGHEDLMSSRQEFPGQSAGERLHELAKDLGECYMAADLPALLAQKRDKEVEQTVPRIDKSRFLADKTPELWSDSFVSTAGGPETVGKADMQGLLINLLAGVLSDANLDQVSRMRSPMNGVYLYLASTEYRQRLRQQYLKTVEQGEAEELACVYDPTLQGADSPRETAGEEKGREATTGKKSIISSTRGQRLPSIVPPSEIEESKSSASEYRFWEERRVGW